MNRKQRRATMKHDSSASGSGGKIKQLFVDAVSHERARKLDDAARTYKRVLTIDANHAEACNNLGRVLQALGKTNDASVCYARSLALMPQLLEQYADVRATLFSLRPTLAEALRRQAAAWPQRLSLNDLLGDSLDAATADPLLLCLLQSIPIRDVGLERLLTAMRHSLLTIAMTGSPVSSRQVSFTCALAKQCFINEYVFAITPQENDRLSALKDTIVGALTSGAAIEPMQLAALAMYLPMHALPSVMALLEREWPPAVDDLLTQQVHDHMGERDLRKSIPRLTAIEDEVSQRVRQQYEENPYPRWVHAASVPVPTTIDDHLRNQFPSAPFRPLGKSGIDVLVAGCGTGRHPIEVARKYKDARVLAVDLSLTSLCYAKRKTPAPMAEKIAYAQADILKIGSIERTFDLIDVSGVLHHLADPMAGWRAVLALLRPGGFMRVGLYSELARREIVAARAFILAQGYRPTADDIRRCRQELLHSPLSGVAKFGDFFSTSECRDLLFHVQECRLTIPDIKAFIVESDLKFIGFEFAPRIMQHYRDIFGGDRFMRDLDRWHALETEKPDTFAGMYQFWIQKN